MGILSSFLTDTSLTWDTKWDDGIESLIVVNRVHVSSI